MVLHVNGASWSFANLWIKIKMQEVALSTNIQVIETIWSLRKIVLERLFKGRQPRELDDPETTPVS